MREVSEAPATGTEAPGSAFPDMEMVEEWPGQFAHWEAYDAMVAEHARTGVWRDPVSGRIFPKDQQMYKHPDREQRRRLKRWRRTGRAS